MNDLENLGISIESDSVMDYGENGLGLADFMEVDVSDIEENEGGFSLLPRGTYKFIADEIKVSVVNRKNPETNEDVKIPNVSIKCKVEEVVNVMPDEDGVVAEEDKLIGRLYFHNVSLPSYDGEKYYKAMGRLRALAAHISPDAPRGTFQEVLKAIAGKSFTGKINHRKYATKDDAEGEKSGRAEDLDIKSVKAA